MAAVARNANPDPTGSDTTSCGFNPDDGIPVADKTGDFAPLEDVDAERIGPACIAPGDGVMAGSAAAPLDEAALNREAGAA